MTEEGVNYRREYARSSLHLWWGLATLGLGFLLARPLALLAGIAAYALGWVYLPDMPFFRRRIDGAREAARQAELQARLREFIRQRDEQLASLTAGRRERYAELAGVCEDIGRATADGAAADDTARLARIRKLEELMWTYLRLLGIEQALEVFLETEARDKVPESTAAAEAECQRLSAEVAPLKAKGPSPALEARQRLLGSRTEWLEVLRKRLQRLEQARENLALVRSEQERLAQQIKLIRADAVASRNAETLTARIDATIQHLDETNKWLSEMDEFKVAVNDLPSAELRIGFGAALPPAIPAEAPARAPRAQAKQQDTSRADRPR